MTTYQNILPNLLPSEKYVIRVRSLDANNVPSDWADALVITVPSSSLGVPAEVADVSIIPGLQLLFVKFTSNTEADLDGYDIHVSTASSFTPDSNTLIKQVSPTNISVIAEAYDPGHATPGVYSIVAGVTYYVQVFARNLSDETSATATEVSGTPGVIIGTEIHIPDQDATPSFHVDSNGNMWWGAFASYTAASIKISAAGVVNFTSGTFSGAISGASIDIPDAASGWHVDSNGNMWWGTSATFAGADIKISTAGVITIGDSGGAKWETFTTTNNAGLKFTPNSAGWTPGQIMLIPILHGGGVESFTVSLQSPYDTSGGVDYAQVNVVGSSDDGGVSALSKVEILAFENGSTHGSIVLDDRFFLTVDDIMLITAGGDIDINSTGDLILHGTDVYIENRLLRFGTVGNNDYNSYNDSTNTWLWVSDGTTRMQLVNSAIQMPNGSAGAPSYTFAQDSNTGFYVTGNNEVIRWSGNASQGGYLWGGGIRTADGTLSNPAYSFIASGQGDVGMFRNGTDDLRLSTGGNYGIAAIIGRPWARTAAGTWSVDVGTTSGNLIQGASSRREWKSQIVSVDLAEATAIIKRLSPVTYHYRKEHSTADDPLAEFTERFGFIAQDVESADSRVAMYGWLSKDGWGNATLEDIDDRIAEARDEDRDPTPWELEDMVAVNWDHKQVTTITVASLQDTIAKISQIEARLDAAGI